MEELANQIIDAAIARLKKWLTGGIFSVFGGGTSEDPPLSPRGNTPLPPPTLPPPPIPGGRALVTQPERITARFLDTGSDAWKNQFPGTPMAGRHGGTDFSAPQGSAVYAPFPMRVIAVGFYADPGRMGSYVIGTTTNGLEYYSGHLQNVQVRRGDDLAAGTQLGETNQYNHTHIQIKRGGGLIDPESVLT